MPANAGTLFLDIKTNTSGLKSQMHSLTNMMKGVAKGMAAAFSVAAITKFGKSCIDLGSDLAEVQNVVDVTFPSMAKDINEFAQSAAGSFGLSETMAKKFTGTFGSMAEAFGFTEKQAASMAKTLTGLSGDVASFYNITQDEAFTKLKSVFTGETESLKDLGVVMTQSALDAYALANGYGVTTAKMSEQEKVALRLSFVTNQLGNAQGDFARTSGGWANQIRILSLNFQSLKATIGQSLIAVLLPVVQLINRILTGLNYLAKKFNETFGIGSSTNDGVKQLSTNLGTASVNTGKIGDASKKARTGLAKTAKEAKKLQRSIQGFDKINKLAEKAAKASAGNAGSSGLGSGDVGGGISGGAGADIAEISGNTKALGKIKLPENLQKSLDKLKNAMARFGKVAGGVLKEAYEKVLKPFGKWVINTAIPKFLDLLAAGFNGIADFAEKHPKLFKGLIAGISGLLVAKKVVGIFGKLGGKNTVLVKGLAKLAKGVGKVLLANPQLAIAIGLLAGVAAATVLVIKNWDKIKPKLEKGLKAFKNLGKYLKDKFLGAIGKVKDVIKKFKDIWDGIKDKKAELVAEAKEAKDNAIAALKEKWDSIKDKAAELKASVATKWDDLKSTWEGITTNIKDKVAYAKMSVGTKWDNIKDAWGTLQGNFKDKVAKASMAVSDTWESVKDAWGTLRDKFKDKVAKASMAVSNTWGKVKDKWANLRGKFKDKEAKAKLVLGTKWKDLKESVGDLRDKIENKVSDISSTIKTKWKIKKPQVKWSYKTDIKKLEKAAWKLVGLTGRPIPKLSWLAQGGYVKKNTPQLAVIGDNRHQGEVVAPESKLLAMARQAAAMSGGGNNAEIISLLKQILAVLQTLDFGVYLDGKDIKDRIVALINANTRATGKCEIII